MALWKVQGGAHGERENFALERSVAVIGWDALPDLASIQDRATLQSLLTEKYPDSKLKTRLNWESQIWPFAKVIAPGDWIAMPLKRRPAVALGRCTGPYSYQSNFPESARHTRPVNWLREVPRTAFGQDVLFSLGSLMTVCRIQRNNAEARVAALAEGRAEPAPTACDVPAESVVDLATGRDIEQDARDQIRAHIQQRFAGHAMTRLVAAVLEAQGYRSRVAPEGPDGGVDIIAGRGPLGFEQPRLAVQVKSGDSPSDAKVVRELRGAMEHFRADQGLFVSWSGYKQGVEKDNAREFFRIRLWDGDDLIREIEAHYEALPESIRAELPLKRVWALVPEEDA